MAWFGPKKCNCKCGEPPPPDCACSQVDCYPEGMHQFSSVKIAVEYDDSLEVIRERASTMCDWTPCRGSTIIRKYVQGLSGLSQFNGTYDGKYYVEDEGGWVEGDPAESPCGAWWFPSVVKPVSYWRKFFEFYEDDCEDPIETVTNDDENDLIMYVGAGAITIPDGTPNAAYVWPAIHGASVATTEALARVDRSIEYFDCEIPRKTDVSEVFNYSVDPNVDVAPVYYPTPGLSFGLHPSGTLQFTTPATFPEPIPGTLHRHRALSSCALSIKKWSSKVYGYDDTRIRTSPPPCGSGTSWQWRWQRLRFNEWNCVITASLNG